MSHNTTHERRRLSGARRVARGFMLIEALVAILIFSFGVLGIVGLQASMTKAQTQSKFRADASLLAQRLIGTMWSDRAVTTTLANYATANCAAHNRCSEWTTAVAAALPNGAATIAIAPTIDGILPLTHVNAGNVIAANVTVTITWRPPNEQEHTYTTTSAIVGEAP